MNDERSAEIDETEVRTVRAHYPTFADANFMRPFDSSRQAWAWAALMEYRERAIGQAAKKLREVGGDDADLVGLTACLWAIDEDEAAEILERVRDLYIAA